MRNWPEYYDGCFCGVKEENEYDLITGDKKRAKSRFFSCWWQRLFPWGCGKNAKWFEPKEPEQERKEPMPPQASPKPTSPTVEKSLKGFHHD